MQLFDRRGFVVAAFALLVVSWGSAFPVIKVGLEYAPPMIFAGLSTLLGGLAMTFVALVLGPVLGERLHLKRDWPVFLMLAMFNGVFFVGFQTMSISYLPSGTAAVLGYLQPILVGFLAWVILDETMSAEKILGLFLGFSGIVAVSSDSLSGTISPLGVLLGVSSALFWALGTVYFKKFQGRISTMWAAALQFVVGGGVLTAFSPIVDSWSGVSWSGGLFASLAYVSFVAIALAWMLWLSLVQAGEASRVAAYVFFVPLVSIVFGAIFLDEVLSFSLLVGTVLIISGIYLVSRSPLSKK